MNTLASESQNSISALESPKEIQDSISQTLSSLLNLPTDEKVAKNEDIKSMIRYFNGLTENIEDRRSRVAEFTWQSLAITVTAFGVIMALQIISLFKIPVLVLLGILFLASLIRLREYQIQSAFRYPFLKLSNYGNRWKWFYYGNPHIKKINENPYFVQKTENLDQLLYLKGLDYFLKRYKEENLNKEISDNILQLYLLQVHNFYKNRFYLRLFRYDQSVFWLMIAALVIYSLFILFVWSSLPEVKDFLLTKSF